MAYNNFESNLLEQKVNLIQDIFFEYYDETKRILISSGEFLNDDVEKVFNNIFWILDEIYINFVYNNVNNERFKEILITNFLVAQNYSLTCSIIEINKQIESYSLKYDVINKILINTRNLLKKTKYLDLNKKTKRPEFHNLLNVEYNLHNFKNMKMINQRLKKNYEKTINSILPKWEIGKTNNVLNILDKSDIEYLHSIITNVYGSARYVLIEIMTRINGNYYFAVADMRDALDHIARALIDKDCVPFLELSYATEHIRRAAVESAQYYAYEKIHYLENIIDYDENKHKRSEIKRLFKYKELLSCARYNKSTTKWNLSINNFYKIITDLDKMQGIIQNESM